MLCDRVWGLLAHTMGNVDKAAEHFEKSLIFCRKAGYRPDLAWTCSDYAETLRSGTVPVTRRRLSPCWMSPWPSPASWACSV